MALWILLLACAQAAPVEYRSQLSGAVKELMAERFGVKGVDEPCGPPIEGQKMYFAGPGRCSIASADMDYLAHDGTLQRAVKGKQIAMNCDDVMCPVPMVSDCYMSPEICQEDEWCWIEQHEKWGPWAMAPMPNGTYGHTPEPDYCSHYMPAYEKALAEAMAQNEKERVKELNASRQLLCPKTSQVFDNAWRPIRGQCVSYRKEQQSCFQAQELPRHLEPRYKLDPKGFPMERPLACAPNLACTAPNFNVLPSTCVQKRPKDICYYGPWWDSSDCPRAKTRAPGLSYNLTVDAMISAAMLYPSEIASQGSCAYWDRTTSVGRSVLLVRQQVYRIASELWPSHVLKASPPSLETLSRLLPDPFEYLVKVRGMTREKASEMCPKLAQLKSSRVAKLLAEAQVLASQPNKVWSLVHFLTFNLLEVQIHQKGLASQALASLLAQNFWCNDCRSFFQVGVIEQFGLPPLGSGIEIARWWHHAHNVASEHVATTRAGHPWIHQLDALKEYQNPFYMTWQDAYEMWRADVLL